jgi:1-acyl-sn-glycerol-3-phosphate acyltransferase
VHPSWDAVVYKGSPPTRLKAGGGIRLEETLLNRLLYLAGRAIVLLYARLMLRLDVAWQAPMPRGPKIIVANHPSTTDPIYLSILSPAPLSMLLIVYPFLIPIVGTYLRLSGHVPVVPGEGRTAFDEALRLLQNGRSVVLFPEGDVSPQDGGFRRPRTGAARLALLTGLPVVPVGIYIPRERNRSIEMDIDGTRCVSYVYVRGQYAFTVGEPVNYEGPEDDRRRVTAVAGHIMERIIALARHSEGRVKALATS